VCNMRRQAEHRGAEGEPAGQLDHTHQHAGSSHEPKFVASTPATMR
jgi:hypothetical protein